MSHESAECTVSVSPRVLDPASFAQEISRRVGHVRQASGNGSDCPLAVDVVGTSSRVRSHIAGASQLRGTTHPGWRGAIAGRIKGAVRRLIYWYVDPVFDVQQNNADLLSEQLVLQARIIADLREEIAALQHALADVRSGSARLQKSFRSILREFETESRITDTAERFNEADDA